MIGTRLGPYEITAKLGEGGMGEVYRATDTKLKREVAIKVLPAAFTEDKERLARFEREAQLLAQLHHPNIASIFGLEESDGVRALVMELVPGPTLAERLESGPLSLTESLSFALQIAQALEEAHDKGIVHRDLKPQNIKASSEGKAKVLDFGLAKAMDSGAGSAASVADFARSPTIMNSPTLTAVHGTQLGVILGTAAYMAPEQARGGAVDKRADIWAFGVVLYEMLTGKSLFAGPTVSDTLAGVLKTAIDFAELPADTPPAIRQLLRRCLERNPKDRLHDIADARIVIAETIAGKGEEFPPVVASMAAPAPARRHGRWIALAALAALAVGVGAGRLMFTGAGAGGDAAVAATSFERLTFRPGHFTNARFAPDGQTVFLAADWNRTDREIFQVRPKVGELAIGLAGVELLSVSSSGELAVLLPRISYGNAYSRSGTLALVSASGGTPRELADNVLGADWAPDGKSLAVLRIAEGKWRVEFPLGTLLYESPVRIYWIRVSPKGDAVAFFEREPTGLLSVVVVERTGARQAWSTDWADWWNLAWSPDGEEVWFGASRAGAAASIYAVDRRGSLRTLLGAPGTLELHDVAPDRSFLLAQVDTRNRAFGARSENAVVRDLSWLEDSTMTDLSSDGNQALLEVTSEREPGGTAIYLRSMDGAAPVRLGPGIPQELSRDGKWVLAIRGSAIVALPTAAGEEKVIETKLPGLIEARFLPDGIRVLAVAREPSGWSSVSEMSFAGGAVRSIVAGWQIGPALQNPRRLLSPVSPDGRFVATAMASGQVAILPLDGGAPRPLPGSGPNDYPIEWSPDGRDLYLFDPSTLPTRVFKVDVASGRRELWREILPIDQVGVSGIQRVAVTPDGSAYAYSYQQVRSNLYLVKGLR